MDTNSILTSVIILGISLWAMGGVAIFLMEYIAERRLDVMRERERIRNARERLRTEKGD